MNDQRVTGWASASAVSGRTVAALRAMVAQGELHADRDDRNRNVFSRVDLEALRPADLPEPGPQAGQSGTTPTSDGELAARVIEDLEAGRSLSEIAVAHRVAPDVLTGSPAACGASAGSKWPSPTPAGAGPPAGGRPRVASAP